MNKVILYGNSVLSQMVFFDAVGCCCFEIAGFAVDKPYLKTPTFCGLPQVDFAEVKQHFPPDQYDMLAVLGGFSDMRGRAAHYQRAKAKGYQMRNYISSRSELSPDVTMGENNIILSQSYIGFGGRMGDNNIIRQQVYLGHDFTIGSHNFIGPGCNIAGYCSIANTCYIAMGSTVINNTNIAEETLVGAGSVVIRHTEPYSKNVGNPARMIGYHQEEGIRMRSDHG